MNQPSSQQRGVAGTWAVLLSFVHWAGLQILIDRVKMDVDMAT